MEVGVHGNSTRNLRHEERPCLNENISRQTTVSETPTDVFRVSLAKVPSVKYESVSKNSGREWETLMTEASVGFFYVGLMRSTHSSLNRRLWRTLDVVSRDLSPSPVAR